MKKNVKIVLMLILIALAGAWVANHYFLSAGTHGQQQGIIYTCPMHPQVRQDHPGDCPICGMTLVPLGQPEKSESSEKPQTTGAHISKDQQSMLGIHFATAEMKVANKHIQVSGKVAFDVDLLTAQQEFLSLYHAGTELAQASKQRLLLAGMSEANIEALLKVGKPDQTLVETAAPRWITASLFAEEAKLIQFGMTAKITAQDGHEISGKVQTLEPVIGVASRLVQARIQLEQGDKNLRPQELVRVAIEVPLGQALVIPRSAVLDSGVRKIVMVQAASEHFVSREIEVGTILGDEVTVQHGLSAGEKVVQDAAFLVDAESQLKSALVEAVHQHGGE